MSHRKLTHISIYVLLTVLLSSLASAAIWDPLGLISVIPDDGVNAGDYFLKIHNVDPYEHIVTFTIKYKQKRIPNLTLSSGVIRREDATSTTPAIIHFLSLSIFFRQ